MYFICIHALRSAVPPRREVFWFPQHFAQPLAFEERALKEWGVVAALSPSSQESLAAAGITARWAPHIIEGIRAAAAPRSCGRGRGHAPCAARECSIASTTIIAATSVGTACCRHRVVSE